MSLRTPSFTHDFEPGGVHFGRSCIDHVDETLSERGLNDALVVCGSTVGSNGSLMDPIMSGLGRTVAGVFDETTPAKTLSMVFDGVEQLRATEADAIVAVGGGSVTLSRDHTSNDAIQLLRHSLAEDSN